MNNAVPPLLALLLVCSLPAMAVVAAGPSGSVDSTDASSGIESQTELNAPVVTTVLSDPVNATDTTNRLSLDGAVRSSYTVSEPDLGTSLVIGDSDIRADYDAFQLEATFDNRSSSERQEVIEADRERISEQILELEEREREAVSEHAVGNLSDQQLLRAIVRVSAEAAVLEQSLDQLNGFADEIPGYSVPTRSLRGELDTYQSPVRERIAANLNGEISTAESETVMAVQTTEDGAVFEVIDGVEYTREATRYDNRDRSTPDQFDNFSSATQRVEELYPWAVDSGSRSIHGYTQVQLYGVNVNHEQGELQAYLDGGTRSIYHEVQVLSLNQLPIELEETWTNESVELTANQTPANGPIEVSVTDEETGDPIDATISVDETVVGETDVDGSLWVIPPHGDYELSAQTSNTTVTAELTR